MDLDSTSLVDLGTVTGLNMDIVHHLRRDTIDTEDTTYCLQRKPCKQFKQNCGTDITQRRSPCLDLLDLRFVIAQWVGPQVIRHGDMVMSFLLGSGFTNREFSYEQPSTSGHLENYLCSLFSKHGMTVFHVAATLINKFHQRVTDGRCRSYS